MLWLLHYWIPLIHDLFVIILLQNFRKGRPDLCSEMTCQQNSTTYHQAGDMSRAVAGTRLYYDRITGITPPSSTSTTSFPSLHGAVTIPHPVDHTRLILSRSPLFLSSAPFLSFPPTFTQYESNQVIEESLRCQQAMENMYGAMLRIGQKQDLNRRQHNTTLAHNLAWASSYRNNNMPL